MYCSFYNLLMNYRFAASTPSVAIAHSDMPAGMSAVPQMRFTPLGFCCYIFHILDVVKESTSNRFREYLQQSRSHP